MKVFVLDDSKKRINIIIDNFNSFAEFFYADSIKLSLRVFDKTIKYDLLMLDHDLGFGKNNNGLCFCKFLKDYEYKDVQILIHSHNPDGVKRMEEELKLNGFNNITKIEFGTFMAGWKNGFIGFLGHFKYDK